MVVEVVEVVVALVVEVEHLQPQLAVAPVVERELQQAVVELVVAEPVVAQRVPQRVPQQPLQALLQALLPISRLSVLTYLTLAPASQRAVP